MTDKKYKHKMDVEFTILALMAASLAATISYAPEEAVTDKRGARVTDRAITSSSRRAIVIGSGNVAVSLAEKLEEEGGYTVVGLIDDVEQPEDDSRFAVLGSRANAMSVISSHDVGHVFVAYAPTWQQTLAEQLAAQRPEIQVGVVPSSYEACLKTRSVESFGDVAVIRMAPHVSAATECIKRAFDIVASIICLLVFFPVMIVAGILIKATSPGPVLFRQTRIGRHGKEFGLYKLRTMRVDAESATGPVLSPGKTDSRLTSVGYWLRLVRFDELPQLWNVLRGDMSMVGPRPERPVFVEKFLQTVPSYSRRHDVRPGIAGLAQLHGGYHTDARDKLRFDLIYVTHQSMVLDISILVRTFLLMILPQRKKLEAKNAVRK